VDASCRGRSTSRTPSTHGFIAQQASENNPSTDKIIVINPTVANPVGLMSALWIVRIHHVVFWKLSNAVLPSSTLTTPDVPGGACQAARLYSGLTARSRTAK